LQLKLWVLSFIWIKMKGLFAALRVTDSDCLSKHW